MNIFLIYLQNYNYELEYMVIPIYIYGLSTTSATAQLTSTP